MRPTQFHFILTLFGSCILLPLSSPAPLTAYLKIGDIKGESQRAGHEDWIIIDSIDSSGLEETLAGNRPTGKRQHRPFTAIKPLDKASPLLMRSLVNGETLPEVIVEATESYLVPGDDGTATEKEMSYFRYKLQDVMITAMEAKTDLDGDPDRPLVEAVTFEYPYAEWHVRQLGPDGSLVDTAGAFFDMELNEGGPASIGPIIEQIGNIDVAAGDAFDVDIRIEDFDTPYLDLVIEVDTDPVRTNVGPIKWMSPEMIRVSMTTTPTASGQTPVTVRVSDGDSTRSMSFSVFIDGSGTPWDGFLMAYFSEEERANPNVSSPIEDPDGDDLETLLEFLLGTNPREFTPVEILPKEATGNGGSGRIVLRPDYLDPDDDGDAIGVEFDRRVDDPRIRLSLHASFNGGETWTRLDPESGDNPLYKERTTVRENPLYEGVNGSVDPPDEATAILIRFVGEME